MNDLAAVAPPPADLIEARLGIAARVAAGLVASPGVIAVAVVGSTALGRCSPTSDLDLVAIVELTPSGTVSSDVQDGVRVDVEWLSVDQACEDARCGGWTWELRKSARLGQALPLHDPGGLFDRLATLAANAEPDRVRYAEHLRDTETLLDAIVADDTWESAEAFRGVVDMLALLVLLRTPRRYQKAKWALDDLAEQGEQALCGAIAEGYGIARGGAIAATAAARRYVAAALARAGEPDAATLVAMGYAPVHAAASYVARTLADADDRHADGDGAAAHFTAGFAARLAAALSAQPARAKDADYRACFAGSAVTPRALAATRDAAARCRRWLGDEARAAA